MAKPRDARAGATQRLILDSGALIAVGRGNLRVRSFLARALELETSVEVPAVVLAETLRGGPRDAPVNQLLNSTARVAPTTEAIGRLAGRLQAEAGMTAVADAIVVAHALIGGPARLLTSDPDDLARLVGRRDEVSISVV